MPLTSALSGVGGGLDTKLHGELAALSCGYPPLRRCRQCAYLGLPTSYGLTNLTRDFLRDASELTAMNCYHNCFLPYAQSSSHSFAARRVTTCSKSLVCDSRSVLKRWDLQGWEECHRHTDLRGRAAGGPVHN
jgi:hypothetical protein